MDKTRLKMLKELMEAQFAVVELNLYLDTHPCDEKALHDFNVFAKRAQNIQKLYEAKYGPLSPQHPVKNADYWSYIDSPWPWEIEY